MSDGGGSEPEPVIKVLQARPANEIETTPTIALPLNEWPRQSQQNEKWEEVERLK
jgi:hypothetical protein